MTHLQSACLCLFLPQPKGESTILESPFTSHQSRRQGWCDIHYSCLLLAKLNNTWVASDAKLQGRTYALERLTRHGKQPLRNPNNMWLLWDCLSVFLHLPKKHLPLPQLASELSGHCILFSICLMFNSVFHKPGCMLKALIIFKVSFILTTTPHPPTL